MDYLMVLSLRYMIPLESYTYTICIRNQIENHESVCILKHRYDVSIYHKMNTACSDKY